MRGVAAGQRRIGDPRVMDRAAQTAPAPAAPAPPARRLGVAGPQRRPPVAFEALVEVLAGQGGYGVAAGPVPVLGHQPSDGSKAAYGAAYTSPGSLGSPTVPTPSPTSQPISSQRRRGSAAACVARARSTLLCRTIRPA